MRKGSVIANFKLLETKRISKHTRVYRFEHLTTKTELLFEKTTGPEFFYSIGFNTPALDDRGLTHILEHCVLAGSKKFPVKDPFVQLLKSSHQTFLNALTFPEFTVYPVGSTNKQSFRKLMRVYTDAVFDPLVKTNKGIFLQEGWRYEKEKGRYKLSGVVFNEMQGALAKHENYLGQACLSALYPGTNLAHQSGGDPRAILDLDYQDLVKYHETYYHPSNARILIRGDIDNVEWYLSFLEKEYLSRYPQGQKFFSLRNPRKVTVKKYEQEMYAPQSDTYSVGKAWSVSKATPRDILERNFLGYILGNAKDGILYTYLSETELFESVDFYHESDLATNIFSIDLVARKKRVSPHRAWSTINTFFSQAKNFKLHKQDLAKRLRNFAFAHMASLDREDGYRRMRSFYPQWMAGNNPLRFFEETQVLHDVMKSMTTQRASHLIQKYLVTNDHYAQVSVIPRGEKKYSFTQSIKKKEEAINASSQETRLAIDQDRARYELYRDTKDSGKALNLFKPIPLTALSSQSLRIPTVSFREGSTELIQVKTRGELTYLYYAFNLDGLSLEQIILLDLWSILLPKMPLPEGGTIMDRVSSFSSRTVFTSTKSGERKRVLVLQFGYLQKNNQDIHSFITTALRQGVIDAKTARLEIRKILTRAKQNIITRGNYYAALRSAAHRDPQAFCGDALNGIGSIEYLSSHQSQLANKLTQLRAPLSALPLQYVVTNDRSLSPDSLHHEVHPHLLSCDLPSVDKLSPSTKEEHVNNSITVNYNAQAWHISRPGLLRAAHRILCDIVTLDYLWKEIRERGGAYGAQMGKVDGVMMYLSSYRDSQVKRTFRVFDSVEQYLQTTVWPKEFTLDRYIVRSFSELDRPLSTRGKVSLALRRKLGGISSADLDRYRRDLKSMDKGRLKREARSIFASMKETTRVVIGAGEPGKKYKKTTVV